MKYVLENRKYALGHEKYGLGHVKHYLGHEEYRLGRVRYALGKIKYALGKVKYALGHVKYGLGRVKYITILNYGGPDRSIKMKSFEEGVIKPRRYRNRRLGDFLKELDLTEGRATGIPLIHQALKENDSPPASFRY